MQACTRGDRVVVKHSTLYVRDCAVIGFAASCLGSGYKPWGAMFSRWTCKDLKRCIELPRQACEAAGSFSAVVAGMRLGFSAVECQSLSGTSMPLNPCAFSCERAFWALYHCRHARPPDTRLPVKS